MNRTNRLSLRVCGTASILAGVVWAGGTIFNLVVGGSIEPPNQVGGLAALGATTLMVFAFVGIYAGQSSTTSLLGLVGAVMGIIGAVLISGVNAVAFARAVGAVDVLRPPIEIGGPGVIALVMGVFLLGVSSLRAEEFSRGSGALFILAVAMLPFGAVGGNFSAIPILIASIGFVRLGWEVWSGTSRSTTQHDRDRSRAVAS